ncbi:NRDE family protein [bacterium]|nr:NRDE family protein [bacterium]
MCLIVVAVGVLEESPLALASNREESPTRPGTPPFVWERPFSHIFAGRDPLGGGTWLGVGKGGGKGKELVVALTNRPYDPQPAERSRGLLVRDLLGEESAASAATAAQTAFNSTHYDGCNLVLADRETTWIADSVSGATKQLGVGIHLIGLGEANDPKDKRFKKVRKVMEAYPLCTADDWITHIPVLLSDHGIESICRCQAEGRPTISADVLTLGKQGVQWVHAQGPPCSTKWEKVGSTTP